MLVDEMHPSTTTAFCQSTLVRGQTSHRLASFTSPRMQNGSHSTATAQTSKSSRPSPVPLPSPPPLYYDFSQLKVHGIRATHCRLLTSELAYQVDSMVRRHRDTLENLATQLSICVSTKNRNGDTGWYFLNDEHEHEHEDKDKDKDKEDIFHEEFVNVLKQSRPGELKCVQLSYAWEVFIVTDLRQHLHTSHVGTSRMPGLPLSGRMRRKSIHPPQIEDRTYFIETLGCQMNASDSERMAACLESAGYTLASKASRSSIYILNTCALRDHAQQKVYSYLGEHTQRKWDAPQHVTLIVAGCVAQQEGNNLLSQVPELDIVMGPQYANRVTEVLNLFFNRQAQIVMTEPVHIHEDLSVPKRESKVTAWVNIMYGCNERCTYCVVPNTRGLEQSRPMQAIRKEIEHAIIEQDVKEVILLGQNVDAYGRDLSPKKTFANLLQYIHDIPGLKRIRFTTGHPRYISQNLIDVVASLPNVMEHFHIPPQSGDNQVLKSMRRGYTAERYISIVKAIRDRMPDASICADMIVGFPGETDKAFENTLALTEQVVFDANMIRAYSARPGTEAATRHDQVEEHVKKKRLAKLNDVMKTQALYRSRRYLNRVVQVLVEGHNEKVAGEMTGRERTNRVVFFQGDSKLVGAVVDVFVEEAFTFSLRGHVVRIVDE